MGTLIPISLGAPIERSCSFLNTARCSRTRAVMHRGRCLGSQTQLNRMLCEENGQRKGALQARCQRRSCRFAGPSFLRSHNSLVKTWKATAGNDELGDSGNEISLQNTDFEVVSSSDEGVGDLARDDDVLPDSLTDALDAAAESTSDAIDSGCNRCVVEILLPEFWDPLSGPVYAEEGDQQRFWKLTRRFIDDVLKRRSSAKIRAIYPDAGVAAMLTNNWADAGFQISSLNDRKPVSSSDEVIIVAAPDPPGLDYLMKIGRNLEEGQSLVLFNPRVASGDVGVGLNIRRLRESFLKEFVTVYSLRPIGDVGTVFKKFPELWKVFVQDPDLPGRYLLAAERPSRPGGEALDMIVMQALGMDKSEGDGGNGSPGLLQQIGVTLNGLQRFMRSLSQ